MEPLDVASEFANVNLGDLRRNARAVEILSALQRLPDANFPAVFPKGAALEAYYRFTRNGAVDADTLLSPHRAASWERGSAERLWIVIHDTTHFSFPGEIPLKGLPKSGSQYVLYEHVSLLVGLGPTPVVHGIVGARSYVVDDGVWVESLPGGQEVELVCGSHRWSDAVASVHAEAPAGPPLVHVMDREADDFMLWSKIIDQGDHFVNRSARDRVIEGKTLLARALEGEPCLLERTVRLARRSTKGRPPATRKEHPSRDERPARLAVRAGPVTIKKPKNTIGPLPPHLKLGMVEVTEIDPPPDAEPVHWRILTSLPVETAEDAARIVDIYGKRWLIEEYFKALKTGCAVEKRQAESLATLNVTIALLMPIAVRLLQIRAMARHDPDAPAAGVLDPIELQALRHHAAWVELPKRPTQREVMLAIAALGGHIKANGDPGWIVLGRGLEKLISLAEGWKAALSMMKGGNHDGWEM